MSLKSAFYNTYSPITTNPPSLHNLHPHPHHQATTGDESRHMRALLDSQHAEVATLTAELTTVQAQLTSILAEKTTLEDEDRSLKMTHKQTVAELERVQEVTRQLEEEIEMTRVELKGTTAELLTFKSSLDSAEALLSSQVTPNHPSQTSLAINPHNHPLQYTQSSSPLPLPPLPPSPLPPSPLPPFSPYSKKKHSTYEPKKKPITPKYPPSHPTTTRCVWPWNLPRYNSPPSPRI